jgi:hypothetical protein
MDGHVIHKLLALWLAIGTFVNHTRADTSASACRRVRLSVTHLKCSTHSKFLTIVNRYEDVTVLTLENIVRLHVVAGDNNEDGVTDDAENTKTELMLPNLRTIRIVGYPTKFGDSDASNARKRTCQYINLSVCFHSWNSNK